MPLSHRLKELLNDESTVIRSSTVNPKFSSALTAFALGLSCLGAGFAQESRLAAPAGEITQIYRVQGDGAASPLEGERVTVRGVVVGDFQERDELGGFFIQELIGDDRSETSDGLFVFQRSSEVEVGEVVEVTGEVAEYHDLTELTDVSSLQVVGRADPPVPVRVSVPLPAGSSWERYEGMLVTIESADGSLAVSEVYHLGRGGLVLLADDPLRQFTQEHEPSVAGYGEHRALLTRRSIVLDDGSTAQNPDPIVHSASGDELTAHDSLRVGDTTSSVTGVLSYSYSGWRGTDAYRLHPIQEVEFVTANPRPPLPPEVGGTLQVASFNVLNFFNGDGQGGGFPTTRGAESRAELERQLGKLVAAIVPMDAEVLGFVEIENDGGPNSALAELVAALNAATGEESYDYIETGPLGRDEIRVALAYQPGRVRPVGTHRVLNSSVDNDIFTSDPRFDDRRNRPALAQTFEEIEFGARFTVIVNHLKSKGSACPGDGREPPDGQGNCNDVRLVAAAALADWAEELAQEAGDPDVLITGDLNSYAMEDPVRLLRGRGFIDLLGTDETTYVFAGEAGTLDYALVTPSLAQQVTGAAAWHINTEEPSVLDYNTNFKSDRQIDLLYSSSPYRSSDHDPLVIGIDLQWLD